MSKIGFIGLGIMGRPMAGHLQAAGHELYVVKHRSALPRELLEGGATECGSAKEVAERAETVIAMVPDTPDVAEVLFGEGGVAEGIGSGKTVIDMSSISPIETRAFAERIEALGSDYVDAPVSGGEVGAKNASLTIMVGAREQVFERVKPLFEVMGKSITRIGDPGAGQIAKVANQIIVALNLQAVAEALVFAAKAGADPARVREALMGGFAGSKILDVHAERMLKRTFDPGFRIKLHRKDIALALEGARSLGLALPNTATVAQILDACAAQGWSDLDHSAIVRVTELLAGHALD